MMVARQDERNFVDHGQAATFLSEGKAIAG
jgi:hypothetical protein